MRFYIILSNVIPSGICSWLPGLDLNQHLQPFDWLKALLLEDPVKITEQNCKDYFWRSIQLSYPSPYEPGMGLEPTASSFAAM